MKTSKAVLTGVVATMLFGGVAAAAEVPTVATKKYVDTKYIAGDDSIIIDNSADGKHRTITASKAVFAPGTDDKDSLFMRYVTSAHPADDSGCASNVSLTNTECGWTLVGKMPAGADGKSIQILAGNVTNDDEVVNGDTLYWRYTDADGCTEAQAAEPEKVTEGSCGWKKLTALPQGKPGKDGISYEFAVSQNQHMLCWREKADYKATCHPVSGEDWVNDIPGGSCGWSDKNCIEVPDGKNGLTPEFEYGTQEGETKVILWRYHNENGYDKCLKSNGDTFEAGSCVDGNGVQEGNCCWTKLFVIPSATEIRIAQGNTEDSRYKLYWRYQTKDNTSASCSGTDDAPFSTGTNNLQCGWQELATLPVGPSVCDNWLAQPANAGKTMDDCFAALRGEEGKSAYQLWLAAGNTGTQQDFLDSLKGDNGYQVQLRVQSETTQVNGEDVTTQILQWRYEIPGEQDNEHPNVGWTNLPVDFAALGISYAGDRAITVSGNTISMGVNDKEFTQTGNKLNLNVQQPGDWTDADGVFAPTNKVLFMDANGNLIGLPFTE